MKPKQWLADNGHIDKADINKRGRMSGAHKALIMEAVANGVHIEGYSVVKPDAVTAKPDATPTVARTGGNGEKVIADIGDPVREASQWEAYDDTGARIVTGIKSVCDNCRTSFTYCRCSYPVKMLDGGRVSVVTFKQKKGA